MDHTGQMTRRQREIGEIRATLESLATKDSVRQVVQAQTQATNNKSDQVYAKIDELGNQPRASNEVPYRVIGAVDIINTAPPLYVSIVIWIVLILSLLAIGG